MLKALGWIVKLSLFSVAILLAGEWVHWNGKTLAQHVRWQADHVGRTDTAAYVRGLTRKVSEDAREGFDKKVKQLKRGAASAQIRDSEASEVVDRTEMQAAAPMSPSSAQAVARTEEPIAPSERQKLKALIHELNSD